MYGKVVKASMNKAANREMSIRDWVLVDLMEVLQKVCPNCLIHPVFLLPHFQTAGELRMRNCTDVVHNLRIYSTFLVQMVVFFHA